MLNSEVGTALHEKGIARMLEEAMQKEGVKVSRPHGRVPSLPFFYTGSSRSCRPWLHFVTLWNLLP